METILIVFHLMLSIGLVGLILIQHGKGADMGAAFGGGSSQTLFGSTGASTFLSKATTVAAVIFMLTSLTLACLATLTKQPKNHDFSNRLIFPNSLEMDSCIQIY